MCLLAALAHWLGKNQDVYSKWKKENVEESYNMHILKPAYRHTFTSLSPNCWQWLPEGSEMGWREEGAFTFHLIKLCSGLKKNLQKACVILLCKLKRETKRVELSHFPQI